MILGIFNYKTQPALAQANDIVLEAQDGIESDPENGVVTATNHVRISRDGVVILADKVEYHQRTGAIVATGNVTITEKNLSYQTDFLTYNLKTKVGTSKFFHGKLVDQVRDGFFEGKDLKIEPQRVEINQISFTRCALNEPHYRLKAKRAIITEEKIKLQQVVLTLHGIPIFYFPSFSFKNQIKEEEKEDTIDYTPDIMIGYDDTSGIWAQYQQQQALNDHFNLALSGKVATKTKAEFNVGLGYRQGSFADQINLGIEWGQEPTISNILSYDLAAWSFSLSEWHSFSAAASNKLGINLTKKYFPTTLGNWQIGAMGYYVTSVDNQQRLYGGSYAGLRLDYQPFSYLNLHYLYLNDLDQQNDYRDLGPDAAGAPNGGNNFGSSLGASLNIPLKKGFKLGMNSSYNLDQAELLQLNYSLNYDTCCYQWSVDYDQLGNKWQFSGALKF